MHLLDDIENRTSISSNFRSLDLSTPTLHFAMTAISFFLPHVNQTARYLFIPLHGSPYNKLLAATLHLRSPLQSSFTILSEVSDRQKVVFINFLVHVISSIRPYIADCTFINRFSGHVRIFDFFSQTVTWCNPENKNLTYNGALKSFTVLHVFDIFFVLTLGALNNDSR